MWRLILIPVISVVSLTSGVTGEESTFQVIADQPNPEAGSTLRVDAVDADSDQPIPVRVTVTDADGHFVDGSGRGLYRDGRFFADGSFTVAVTRGETRVEISHGPHYAPLTFSVDVGSRRDLHVQARLQRWFSPAARGWYGGDNHVHAQHDRNAAVQTDLRYTALQARAAGLNFVTEAGSDTSYDEIDRLDTPDFLLRYAPELRPGPYVGHLNTPGIRAPLPDALYQSLVARPLPAQALFEAVRARGGVVTHTHPLTPVHQLHWMGATEAFSDAVLGQCADLFDIDAKHTEALWFAMLNLGNRVGASSYTDSALGRNNTLSPGDRRLYCRTTQFDYPTLVEAMRKGRTMATNAGPVFVFLSAEGHEPGDVVTVSRDSVQVTLEVHSLNILSEVELFQDGRRVAAFDVRDKKGALKLSRAVSLPPDRSSWLVARAQDQAGKWCLTSPIYFEPGQTAAEATTKGPASAILFEINNTIRFVELRPRFIAHLLVTLRPSDALARIEWLRNEESLYTLRPSDGDRLDGGRIPVTGPEGDYAEGWIWYPAASTPQHVQADLPVTETGWYAVRVMTRQGKTLSSDRMYFDRDNPASHALSIANLSGPDTQLALWGYGEELPLVDIEPPYNRGQWWYPQKTYWRMVARFGDQMRTFGWPTEQPLERFREAASIPSH